MTVKIKIAPEEEAPSPAPEPAGIKIEIVDKERIEKKLKLRSALNGDLMILDHKDIDIVVQPTSKKIVTFAKEIMSDAVYGAESRLLEYLRRQGVINHDSIKGGNVYGSLEGQIMDSETHDPIKVTLIKISEWMDSEQPYIAGTTAYDDLQDDALVNPDNEHSTELGEVPHEDTKGSMQQRDMFAPYLYGRYTY
tara:strand:+ start:749 stop:1330 length:582 start_codon:yes stop_codon:yes gene_type:complete